MKINKLTICNFGSYEDIVAFDFSSTQPDKNIILIGGKNGAGKTTIFSAIKTALYGHLAYGYKSASQGYLDEIRINNNSLSKEDVVSFVELSFELEEDQETAVYDIRREWKFARKLLNEHVSVRRQGTDLCPDDIIVFENYLKGIMPPQLFNLFFFDGEQISQFFLGGNVSQNLKDALNTLRGFDTFDIIQTHLKRNIHKNLEKSATKETQIALEIQERLDKASDDVTLLEEKSLMLQSQLKHNADERLALETQFKNAGGLKAEEIAEIKQQLAAQDALRAQKHEWLRDFANDVLPFLMIPEWMDKVAQTLKDEESFKRYELIKGQLNSELFFGILNSESPEIRKHAQSLSQRIAVGVADRIKPGFDTVGFVPMHRLSDDALTDVQSTIANLRSRSLEEVRDAKDLIAESLERTTALRTKLDRVETNNELESIVNLMHAADEIHQQLLIEQGQLQVYLTEAQQRLQQILAEQKKQSLILSKIKKDQSVVDLCVRTQSMLNDIVPKLLAAEVEPFRQCFFEIFHALMSKETLVNEVQISDNFEITLYRTDIKTIGEIKTLLSKLGYEGMHALMGQRSIDMLFDRLGIKNRDELKQKLNRHQSADKLELPMKVDIQSLSKGEQQIYIMALYWALIRVSGKALPFVIDTPYARIDETHRDNITTKFFPTLSHQVIILSTDSEVDYDAFKLLEKNIAKTYMISYSNEEKRTIVEDQYFFEVAV